MYEATFRLAGCESGSGCGSEPEFGSYDAITAAFDARLSLWCNDHSDLLLLECETGRREAALEAIDAFAGIEDAIVDGSDAVAVTGNCVKALEATVVDGILDEHGCLLLPPIRYADGARSIRLLALESAHLTHCYHDLLEDFDVTVESKRDLSFDSLDRNRTPDGIGEPLPALSRRQRQVFAAAYERGYYEIPRETSMAAVAESVGIDRRTADEHRRQAERKILESVAGRYLE
ncbi:helix-turn-helix domain-containing protein [Natronosalvus caseinilyticus]|uniref:helix-turn-helix domain-containing protein n=1 Tax=Natronosalvus caseinilyticus TaxID=2953747 RepID=UPI0028A6FB72|nr:helix-turn-helix domain-containing protein [Natronosalvus caseinilyticus]